MIEVFEGRLGGGKTYSAVSRIARHLAQGGTVVTNIRVIREALWAFVCEVYGVEFEHEQLWSLSNEKIAEFHRHVPWGALRGSGENLRVLVVVDEAHLYFNARDWSTCSRELLAFLTQSDKVSVDIIFISQSALNIDKQFARLVQYIWRFRDLSKWKIPGLGISYPLNQILCVQNDYDGKTILDRKFVQKDKRIFGCYETAALLTDFPNTAGMIAKRKLKKVEKNYKMLKFFIPLAVIFGLVCLYFTKEKFNKVSSGQVGVSTSAPAAVPAALASSAKEEMKKAYEIYDEDFRSWSSNDRTLRTAQGWYQVGEMSGKGYVLGVSETRARIALPDGRVGWVVARSRELPLDRGASKVAENKNSSKESEASR